VTTRHLRSAPHRRKPLGCYGSRYRMPILSGPITAGKRTGGRGSNQDSVGESPYR
jgi:hypothetical protein